MFYAKDDVLLRDVEGDEEGALEVWWHSIRGWAPYPYRLQDLDPTTYREADDEEAEAMTNDEGPTQPDPSTPVAEALRRASQRRR